MKKLVCGIVPIHKNMVRDSFEFAVKVTEKTRRNYALRDEEPGDENKYILDHYAGKILEFGGHIIFNTSPPDLSIKEPNAKSYEPDLYKDSLSIHCKAQREVSAIQNMLSHIFQFADKYGNKTQGHYDHKIFDYPKSNDCIMLGLIKRNRADENYPVLVQLLTALPLYRLHEHHLFSAPGKKGLQQSKKAVYFGSLVTTSIREGFSLWESLQLPNEYQHEYDDWTGLYGKPLQIPRS